jgi:hypothetical protein
VDSCWGNAVLVGSLLVSGAIVLGVGLLAAITVVTLGVRRHRRAGYPPGSVWESVSTASRAAGVGVLWGLMALPVLACGAYGFQIVGRF